MSGRLVRSPHLQVIPSRQGYTCYHSLFGNLRVLDQDGMGLLDHFATPRPPEEVVLHHGPQAGDNLREFQRLAYVIEEGSDERERLRQWLKRREQLVPTGYYLCEVELSVSDLCDFDCPYCFADNANRRSQTRRDMAERGDRLMSPESARHILERLVELQRVNGRNRLLVKFIGKEPLLNPRTVAFILDHFQNGEPFGVDIVYHMTTNCTEVPEDLAEKMARRRMIVNASIDMPGEAGELTRRKKGGGRVFDIVDRSIRTMRRHGVEVRLNSVLGRQNYQQHGFSLVDYARTHGITTIALFLVVCDEELAAHQVLSSEEIAGRLFEMWSYARDQGVRLRGYWYNPVAKLVATRNLEFEDQLFYKNSCAGCGNQVNIEPSGDVYSCRMSAPLLGHIDELDTLLHSDLYRRYVMRIYADDCRGCPLEGPCGGLCAGHLEAKTADIYRMDEVHCDIYRQVCRKILQAL